MVTGELKRMLSSPRFDSLDRPALNPFVEAALEPASCRFCGWETTEVFPMPRALSGDGFRSDASVGPLTFQTRSICIREMATK